VDESLDSKHAQVESFQNVPNIYRKHIIPTGVLQILTTVSSITMDLEVTVLVDWFGNSNQNWL
jgi:hypothetical protein